jgi:hypothetical protein
VKPHARRCLLALLAVASLLAGLAAGGNAAASPRERSAAGHHHPARHHHAAARKVSAARKQAARRRLRRLLSSGEQLLANGSFESSLAGWSGYHASLEVASAGIVGVKAARVAHSGKSSSFSIFMPAQPVRSSTAGVAYTGAGWVRSGTPGRTVCLRIRESASGAEVGAAQSCVTSTTSWTPVPAFAYTAKGSGRQVDLYVYEANAARGDSFEVDGLVLTAADAAPAPAPTPSPSRALTATAVDNAHVDLAWPAVPGASAYRVARDSLVLGTTAATTFRDALLWPSTSYGYTVTALGATGASIATLNASATTRPLPASGFQRFFASTSWWNTPVGAAPLAQNSAALSAYVGAQAGSANLTLSRWAVAVAEQHPSDSMFSVPCTRYSCTLSAFGPFGIPATAKPDPAGDGHLAVYNPGTGREWDMWQAAATGSSWTSSAGAALPLTGASAPAGTQSGNAANFPLLAGIIRPEEILQGRIDHALVFMMPGVNNTGYVCPATHHDGATSSPSAPMEGQRFQLDPAIDVDSLPIPAWKKTIARALQVYGMYLRDNSGSFALLAENPVSRGYDAWAKAGLGGVASASLSGIPWGSLRAISAPC